MKYILVVIYSNNREQSPLAIEFNSKDAAEKAKQQLKKDDVWLTTYIFPKGVMSKDEVFATCAASDPFADMNKIADRVEVIYKELTDRYNKEK